MTESESACAPPLDLPVHLTRFVGRERELDALVRFLRTARLITITGAGGSGKTRLAGEAARRVADSYDRVAWVDLVPITDAELLAQQIAAALHIPERSGPSPIELLAESIGDERVLLVLDNCEHLVDACATCVEALLRACPSLTVLATSREALGVASEIAWLVPPLASGEAVQLFVERAHGALPSFALTGGNSAAVAEICRRVDGMPLAIELAAARVRVLSPEQIAGRLDDAFRLLSGGSRTALPRHRTLRATMEWSFALLGAREQVLLRRLSIFAGSFSLDAAEAICDAEPLGADDILDGMSALVDKSLVVMEQCDDVARYRLLETVRQYGTERLAEGGELPEWQLRHAEHYLSVIEAAAPALVGGSNARGLVAQLTADHDNLRAASSWAVADPSRAELGLRFVGALYWFWYALGQFREARQITDRALAQDTPSNPLYRGRALASSALTALAQGEYALSCAHFELALPLLREGGDVAATGAALAKLGAARLLGGDVDGAIAILDDALAFTRDAPAHDVPAIFSRFWRGWAAYAIGDLDMAESLVQRNVTVAREHDLPTTLAHGLCTLARVALARDHVEDACALVSEGLELEVSIGDGWGIGLALDVVALAATRRGRAEDATRLLGGAEAHRHRIAVALPGPAPAEREQLVARLRTSLGDRFDAIHAEGLALATDETVALALAEAARHTMEYRVAAPAEPRASPSAGGTERAQLRVLALGPLQVFVGGELVEPGAWGSARPRELLVNLLMHADGRTKEQVGLAFWPDASTAQLRNNFHVTLHRLRKALGGGEWVTLANERYRIDPTVLDEFDVAEFEREIAVARRAIKRQQEGATAQLEQALARYRGDFLDGEPAGDWHLEHRERLQRLYVDALMELGGCLVRQNRHVEAVATYRRVLARDELHEEALRALMRSHAALDERPQALRVYRRFADQLQQELATKPGAETARLFERLQQDARI
jgi:predicted ATPase/DNA-binding SARP family transcriptional activator